MSSAITKLQSAQMTLQHLYGNPGQNLLQFKSDLVNGNVYREHRLTNLSLMQLLIIVHDLLNCLNARFENLHTDTLYLAYNIFDYKNLHDAQNETALVMHGIGEIKTLYGHFPVPWQNAGCDLDKALSEWNDLKVVVSCNQHY